MTAFLASFIPMLREGVRVALEDRAQMDANRWREVAAAADQRRIEISEAHLEESMLRRQNEDLRRAEREANERAEDIANRSALFDVAVGAGMRPEEAVAAHYAPGGADMTRLGALTDSIIARRRLDQDAQRKQKAIDDRVTQVNQLREKHPQALSDLEWEQALAREKRGEKVFDFGQYRFNNKTGQMMQTGLGSPKEAKDPDTLSLHTKAIDTEVDALKPQIKADEELLGDTLGGPRGKERESAQARLNQNRQRVQALLRQKAALYRRAAELGTKNIQMEAGLGGPPLPEDGAGAPPMSMEALGDEAASQTGTKNKSENDAARRTAQSQALRQVTDQVLDDPKFKDADDATIAAEVRRRLGMR